MWEIGRSLGAVLILLLAIEDLRCQKISDKWLWLLGILALIYQMMIKEWSLGSVASGIGIGIIFLAVSFFTQEALGFGDSILICILGVFVGGVELLEILIFAWSFAGVTAMVVLVKKKFARKAKIPFVPFVAAGYLWVTVGNFLKIMAERV